MKRPRCNSCKTRMKGHKRKRCFKNATLHLEDGSCYNGPTYNNIPSGQGTLETVSGLQYDGFFVAGKREGDGVEIGAGNYSYTGQWRGDLYHGTGTLHRANTVYQGQFRHGKFHGKGILSDGPQTYDGQWSNSMRHGRGHQTLEDGLYTGYFLYGFRHGQGTMTMNNGSSYTGMWKRGAKSGKGTMTDDDYTYTGEWSRDMRHGYGHCVSTNTGEYTGEWYRDMRHGNGINKHDSVYNGEWSYGHYNGVGVIEYPDGSSYKGNWMESEYHGHGELDDGQTTFKGMWSYGHREGIITECGTLSMSGNYCNDVRHGVFTTDDGQELLFIWGQPLVFETFKKAVSAVKNLLRTSDISAAIQICSFDSRVATWRLMYKEDDDGDLLHFLSVSEIRVRFKKYAWKLFRQQRFLMLETMVELLKIPRLDSLLFDCISESFVANPWVVRDQSYSESTKKKLLEGLHVGECGRCPPTDPFTRGPLSEQSGFYLSSNRTLAKTVYNTFIQQMETAPSLRELAFSFDMDDFEQMLQNAQEANDRVTIRRLLQERTELIASCPSGPL